MCYSHCILFWLSICSTEDYDQHGNGTMKLWSWSYDQHGSYDQHEAMINMINMKLWSTMIKLWSWSYDQHGNGTMVVDSIINICQIDRYIDQQGYLTVSITSIPLFYLSNLLVTILHNVFNRMRKQMMKFGWPEQKILKPG